MASAHIAWSTFFRRRGLTLYPQLVHAYRAPMLFGTEAGRGGALRGEVGAVDELVLGADYDGDRARNADGFDLLYISAHGRLRSGEFELLLHSDEWRPADAGLDGSGPRIAVFDACDLLDPQDPNWDAPWASRRRPRLRLVLGFGSLATVSRGSALRGQEFARRLQRGEPVVTAWIGAVTSCSGHRRDRPVGIAFGKDAAEADDLLDNATLNEVLALPELAGEAAIRRRG